jgi:hypothetical protein
MSTDNQGWYTVKVKLPLDEELGIVCQAKAHRHAVRRGTVYFCPYCRFHICTRHWKAHQIMDTFRTLKRIGGIL